MASRLPRLFGGVAGTMNVRVLAMYGLLGRERGGRAAVYLGFSACPAWLLPSAPGFVF